jgi:predicted dehydrogenase
MIRIVQVGMGDWGRDWATRVFPDVPEAALVACVDGQPRALAEVKKLGLVPDENRFGALDSALERVDAAAVLVTTDLPSHIVVVKAALNAGKHVLVEKPFGASVEEAKEAVDLAEALGLRLMVSQNYRFFPAVRAVQKLMRQGRFGQLLHIDLDFRRRSSPSRKRPTGHRNWAQPLLLDMSIHHFDLLRAVIGAEPTSVYCRTHNPAWAGFRDPPEGSAIIAFENDLTVNYRGSWAHPGPITLWAGEWRMEFEKGEVWWTSRGDFQTALEDRASLYSHDASCRDLVLPQLKRIDRAGALDAFVKAVSAGTEPESSGRENLGSLSLAHAAVESSLRRELVSVPLIAAAK